MSLVCSGDGGAMTKGKKKSLKIDYRNLLFDQNEFL